LDVSDQAQNFSYDQTNDQFVLKGEQWETFKLKPELRKPVLHCCLHFLPLSSSSSSSSLCVRKKEDGGERK